MTCRCRDKEPELITNKVGIRPCLFVPESGPKRRSRRSLPLCRAARALVEISRETLAKLARTEIFVIEAFERRLEKPEKETISRIEKALETAGALFLHESRNGEGEGVRLNSTGPLPGGYPFSKGRAASLHQMMFPSGVVSQAVPGSYKSWHLGTSLTEQIDDDIQEACSGDRLNDHRFSVCPTQGLRVSGRCPPAIILFEGQALRVQLKIAWSS